MKEKIKVICVDLNVRTGPSIVYPIIDSYGYGKEIVPSFYEKIKGDDGRIWILFTEDNITFKYICLQNTNGKQYLKIIQYNIKKKAAINESDIDSDSKKLYINKIRYISLNNEQNINNNNNSMGIETSSNYLNQSWQYEFDNTVLMKNNSSKDFKRNFDEAFNPKISDMDDNSFCQKKRERSNSKTYQSNIIRVLETKILDLFIYIIDEEIEKYPELNNKKLFKIGKNEEEKKIPLNKTFEEFFSVTIRKRCHDKNNNINLIESIEKINKNNGKFQEIVELLKMPYAEFWEYFEIYLKNSDLSGKKNIEFWRKLKNNIKLEHGIENKFNSNKIMDSLIESFILEINNKLKEKTEEENSIFKALLSFLKKK